MDDAGRDFNENDQKESMETGELSSSEIAVYQWLHSLQWKGLEKPDGYACLTGKCGETIEIFLDFNGERVKEAAYDTNGCLSSKVCGALAAQLAKGKTPDELVEITAEYILKLLGEFPKSQEHCAFLAAETLQEALHNYMVKQRKDLPPADHQEEA
jgi:nitrogen fixation NifU-like protein